MAVHMQPLVVRDFHDKKETRHNTAIPKTYTITMDTSTALLSHTNPEAAKRYLSSQEANCVQLQNFINGEYRSHSTPNDWIHSNDPRSGQTLARVPRSSAADVDAAVDAAQAAFPAWSKTTREHRSGTLLKIASLVEENRESFAVWESLDQGKTLSRARVEVDRAVANFR